MASNMRPSTRSSAKEKPTESTTASTTASATADPQIISDPTGVNTVGIFKPQPTFTRLVGAAASKVQAILNIDNESSINAWDAQEFHESCTEAFEEVHDEYIKTYNRRTLPSFTPQLASIYESEKANLQLKLKLVVYHNGVVNLNRRVVSIMMPLFRTGNATMVAKRPDGEAVSIDWEPGSVVLVPWKADLHISGSGQMALLLIAWVEWLIVDQRQSVRDAQGAQGSSK